MIRRITLIEPVMIVVLGIIIIGLLLFQLLCQYLQCILVEVESNAGD